MVGERPRLPQVHRVPRLLRHSRPSSLLEAVRGDDHQLAGLPEVPRGPVHLGDGTGASSREMKAGLHGEHARCSEVAEHEEPGWSSVKCKDLCTNIKFPEKMQMLKSWFKYAKADGERGRFLATGDV